MAERGMVLTAHYTDPPSHRNTKISTEVPAAVAGLPLVLL